MKTIERPHECTKRLNCIKKGRKYFWLHSEKAVNYLLIPITHYGLIAFKNENWHWFETAAEFHTRDIYPNRAGSLLKKV